MWRNEVRGTEPSVETGELISHSVSQREPKIWDPLTGRDKAWAGRRSKEENRTPSLILVFISAVCC